MLDAEQWECLLLHGAAGAALGTASMPHKHSPFRSSIQKTGRQELIVC